jgi:YD repeat-containing protein
MGNVTSKTDSKSQTTQYQYDGLNRLILVDRPLGEDDVIYQYDNANNRTLMQSSSASYSYSYQYDGSNRLTKQVVNLGNATYAVDFVYDERNNLVRGVYPSGEVINYDHDAANRLLNIYDASNILFVGNIIYHPSGSPTHHINANYVSSDFTFDNRHRLKTIKISRPFPELKVIRDGLGNGTVTSDPVGIDCGDDCSQIYPADGISVALTAIPDQDSNFVSWGGDSDCSDGIVQMDTNKTCVATFALKAHQFALTVNKAGTGTGIVTSSPAGIDCGSDCTGNYDANTQVILTPVSAVGSSFAGWNGDEDCSDATLTMDGNKTCTATFDLIPTEQFTLAVNKNGSGSGGITSNPAGINCGSDCTENYDANTPVTLTAVPAAGSKFVAWTGDADCLDGVVTMDASKTCTAQFSHLLTLTIEKNGTGTGTVVSTNYPGINCGPDCSEGYDENVLIDLNAIPDPGSNFAGWSGNPDCSDSLVTMNTSKTCIATFNLLPSNQHTLSVNKQGDGFGTVTSTPAGIKCGNDCSEAYDDNIEVMLTPVPFSGGGSIFAGWSGDADCSDGLVTMQANKTCTATFTQSAQEFHLSIDIKGFGEVQGLSGFPFQNEVRIDCTGLGDLTPFQFNQDCEEDYAVNTAVQFEIFRLSECPPGLGEFCTDPEIDYNSTFLTWEGHPDCLDGQITMDANKTCTAVFTPFKLDIFTSGLGAGTVLINPQGNTNSQCRFGFLRMDGRLGLFRWHSHDGYRQEMQSYLYQ